MSTPFKKAGRLPAALAAVLAAAAAGAGAFAPPAAAQAPVPSDVSLHLDNPHVPGAPPRAASLDVAFDEDPTGVLLMRLEVDAPDATVYFGAGTGCETPDNQPSIECEHPDPGPANTFAFTVAAATGTEPGDYDYTLTILLDGTEIHTESGVVEVAEERADGVFRDFTHEYLSFTGVEPGSVVEASPRILQNSALPDHIAALGVFFGGPVGPGLSLDGVGVTAPWDNCTPDIVMPSGGWYCFFTDIEDLPGTVLGFSEPIRYQVDGDAPGPMLACGCSYDLFGISQEVFDRDFGGVWWDPASTNLLGIGAAANQEDPVPGDEPTRGAVDIETTANPYDLYTGGADLRGRVVEVTVPVGNDGPAAALNRALGEEEPAYQLRGRLPEGAELVSLDSDGVDQWTCADSGELDALHEAAGDGTGLDRFDFVCSFWALEPDEEREFTFTVDLDGATGEPGALEVAALYRGVDGLDLDGDPSNDTAALTVDDRALPNTGTSTITVVAVAAGALALGIVLFVLTRRRREPAAAAGDADATGTADGGEGTSNPAS
ncbi:LPXTG cell wall anchor domain-containing protein [Glycomyces terrestris]|uniref:LPXTG cell wall anchor domain-containing protein n=1 Tax=Glycomyces terrestris TaxID=2493553 RepID=A0A426UU00_9ACTN|nr:LPXTG cell wall anchor domain-containing protein [Glycomyces terrestris]RRR97452.1 LPXTG cell wall anchor domain-containing protein [Glycomyces terrestris]